MPHGTTSVQVLFGAIYNTRSSVLVTEASQVLPDCTSTTHSSLLHLNHYQ